MNELEILKREIEELKNWKASLERSSSIPLAIDQAFKERFLKSGTLRISSKGNDSEDQSVNEGGVATYNVAKQYDDFLEVTIDGVIYYVGIYTALT